MSKPKPKIKPSRTWYFVAVIIMLLGPITAIRGVIDSVFGPPQTSIQLTRTGTQIINVEKPGKYSLVIQRGTEHILTSQQAIKVTRKQSNNPVGFAPAEHFEHFYVRQQLGFIDFKKPGQYRVMVPSEFASADLQFNYSSLNNVVGLILKSLLLFIGGLVGGTLILIITFVRRNNAKTALQTTPSKKFTTPSVDNQGERIAASACHLSSFSGFIVPFANVFVPLIIWLIFKNRYLFVDKHGKESLNFQLSLLLYYLIAIVLMFVVIGIFLVPLLLLLQIIAVVVATIEAARGSHFHYPMTIRFFK